MNPALKLVESTTKDEHRHGKSADKFEAVKDDFTSTLLFLNMLVNEEAHLSITQACAVGRALMAAHGDGQPSDTLTFAIAAYINTCK